MAQTELVIIRFGIIFAVAPGPLMTSRVERGSVTFPVESVPCDQCGETRAKTLHSFGDLLMDTTSQTFSIVRCRRCRLIRLDPRPTLESIEHLYPSGYAPFRRSGIAAAARQWLHRRDIAELHALVQYPRRVVDLGSGTGELLLAVRSAGNPRVLGIEPSADAVKIARERHGLAMIQGEIEDAGIEASSIDTVLMSHVLEHVPSPQSTLRKVEQILRPGGSLVIWVPNADSWAARALGRYWMGWDVPRHLYTFSSASLHRMIESVNMIPGPVHHERHGLEWAWALRIAARQRAPASVATKLIELLHPLSAAALTPLGTAAALASKSGRIRVIAHKPMD